MAIYKKGYYDLYMFQGDTGNIRLNGIPRNRDYDVYFNIIYATPTSEGSTGYELHVNSNYHSEVIIPIASSISDNFPVGTHTYAVKLCLRPEYPDQEEYTEETVIPPLKNTSLSPTTFKNKAYFSVYPKQVEGVTPYGSV